VALIRVDEIQLVGINDGHRSISDTQLLEQSTANVLFPEPGEPWRTTTSAFGMPAT
jgi:hypothetical protein